MGVSVVRGVEIDVESVASAGAGSPASIDLRMLGPLAISRRNVPLALPASRKVRALLAYLALASRPVPRTQLCEMFWDVPNDPRGELRWCLSKIRRLIDEPGTSRVGNDGDAVCLDLEGCRVDALEVAGSSQQVEGMAPARVAMLAGRFLGEFLEGLEVDRSPAFNGWLGAQRRRFRAYRIALLERLATDTASEGALGALEQWLELAPYDRRAHELLLGALARQGRIKEGDQHLAATVRLFEAEGQDWHPIRQAWQVARTAGSMPAVGAQVVAPGAPSPPGPADAGSSVLRLPDGDGPGPSHRRASIAVMPFVDHSVVIGGPGGIADALTHDIITRLAKLRSLFVIAQGTVFALNERRIGAEDGARMLDVDFVASGFVRRRGSRLAVTVELAEVRTARIVWADVLEHRLDDAFLVLDEIGNRIVASIAGEIETVERNRAVLKPPNSLDAWEAHHRGLWHMYRFNRADNEQARHFFQQSLRLDPTFARAHAGLSFTHFQNAFQGWAERGPEIDRAFATAEQGLMADDRDPATHWAMGRAHWLRGHHDQSITELEQAVDLSPNFALGHYTLAFIHSQAGDPAAAITSSDHSRHLSPFDPLLFGMLGSRAMALVRLGRFEEAANWGIKAAGRPNAHVHIQAIAAYALALAGRDGEARDHLAAIHRALPRYSVDDFLTAMRFDGDGQAAFRKAARRLALG